MAGRVGLPEEGFCLSVPCTLIMSETEAADGGIVLTKEVCFLFTGVNQAAVV